MVALGARGGSAFGVALRVLAVTEAAAPSVLTTELCRAVAIE